MIKRAKPVRCWLTTAVLGLAMLQALVLQATLVQTLEAQGNNLDAMESAIQCDLQALNGNGVSNWQELNGDVIYVDFWASWCLPCLRSFPFMLEMAADLNTQGLQIVAVNLDQDKDQAADFLANFQFQNARPGIVAVLDVTRECARAFNVSAMPSSYLIDKQGNVHHQHQGFRPEDEMEIRRQVLNLLSQQN